jgi:hypothetical protein
MGFGAVAFVEGILNLAMVFAAAVGFFDALKRSPQAFDAVGRGTRTLWLIGLGAAALVLFARGMFSFFGIAATIGTIVYLVDQRPKLIDITRPRW